MFSTHNSPTRILFQGDSITAAGRYRLDASDLGQGYVRLINHTFNTYYPDLAIECINKGVNGNRTLALKLRWKRDCIHLSPDILSLLVGINDTWRRYDLGLTTSAEKFEAHYRYLLERTLEAFPSTKIILMSPFLLPVQDEQYAWFDDLNPKIQIVEKLAKEYHTLYIPLQSIFEANVTSEKPYSYWASDGVHPTFYGHGLIAKAWLKTVLKFI